MVEPCEEVTMHNDTASTSMSWPLITPKKRRFSTLTKATLPWMESVSPRHGWRANPTGFVNIRKTTLFLMCCKQNVWTPFAGDKN